MACVVVHALLQLVVARTAKVRMSACEVMVVVPCPLDMAVPLAVEAVAQNPDSGVKPQRSGRRTRGC